jgi:hypothetical protein
MLTVILFVKRLSNQLATDSIAETNPAGALPTLESKLRLSCIDVSPARTEAVSTASHARLGKSPGYGKITLQSDVIARWNATNAAIRPNFR